MEDGRVIESPVPIVEERISLAERLQQTIQSAKQEAKQEENEI
jgi:hypothetical protein